MKLKELLGIHHVFMYEYKKDGVPKWGMYVSTTWWFMRPHPIIVLEKLTDYIKPDGDINITNIIRL